MLISILSSIIKTINNFMIKYKNINETEQIELKLFYRIIDIIK